MSQDYFTDNGHILLTGVTGAQGDYLGDGQFGGKSALATWWAAEYGSAKDLVIWGNFKNDDVGDVLTDYCEVGSVNELADEMGRGKRRFVLSPNDYDWAAVSERLEAFVKHLDPDMSKLVILDEAPELSEKAILSFLRVHGNGANCKSIILAQSPTDITTAHMKQLVPVWVGPMKTDYESWFRTHDRHTAYKYILENHEPYHWTVVLGEGEGEWHHYEPVPEEYVV